MSQAGKNPHFFGVRHLSPGGAYHLVRFLNEIKPTAVLVEGLSDANSQIDHFTDPQTQLPLAILAYTEELPVRTLIYPFAHYSPEYQAIVWAKSNGAHVEFIDLPSEVFLKIDPDERQGATGTEETEETGETEQRPSLYQQWARLAGEADHESYWERSFEQNLNQDSYRLAAMEFGRSLRELSSDNRQEQAKNLVREAFMRQKIEAALQTGHAPEKMVVVTGAYHSPALGVEYAPMTAQEFAKLPRVKTRLTLMPYSYYRLSSQAGYGAGNSAPAYYGMLWDCMVMQDMDKVSAAYLTRIAAYLRDNGTPRSAAEVIEGVRLAASLAALRGGSAPILQDLRDAAVTCLGHGDLTTVAEAIAYTEIGVAIGSLPSGVSRTSLQDDFYRELKHLKLEKYKSTVAMDLVLDLRENRRVKSTEAAFLDLHRSCFLHRLRVLQVSFQEWKASNQAAATWSEAWILRWTPKAEIELVESTLKGETIELAASFVLQEILDDCVSIEQAAQVVRTACQCGLLQSLEQARVTLQRLAIDTGAFNEIAATAAELSMVISYGDIRKFDPAPLIPLLQQLFLRSVLLLAEAANCNNQAAGEVADAMHKLNTIALEHAAFVDDELWIQKLAELSDRDDRNPRLSGYACAILLERDALDAERLAGEVSRRLSPGIETDLGAGWFEGLALRNHYALLANINLWEQLDAYVASLDEAQFMRALVFLRRAFGDFGVGEKRTICENLGEVWKVNQEDTSNVLSRELNSEEQKTLNDLADFDFGDI